MCWCCCHFCLTFVDRLVTDCKTSEWWCVGVLLGRRKHLLFCCVVMCCFSLLRSPGNLIPTTLPPKKNRHGRLGRHAHGPPPQTCACAGRKKNPTTMPLESGTVPERLGNRLPRQLQASPASIPTWGGQGADRQEGGWQGG